MAFKMCYAKSQRPKALASAIAIPVSERLKEDLTVASSAAGDRP